MRTTAECEQMNVIYAALDKLQPTANQLRELWDEAVLKATNGTPEERKAAELFCHQLFEHTRKRNAFRNRATMENQMKHVAHRSYMESEKAATAARAISRILRSAGFLMSETESAQRWTEGFRASRVGVSGSVSVAYWTDLYGTRKHEQSKRAREAWPKAKKLLASKGYELDDKNWYHV